MKSKIVIFTLAMCAVVAGCGKTSTTIDLSQNAEENQTEEVQEDGVEVEAASESEEAADTDYTRGIGYIQWSDYDNEMDEDYHLLISVSNSHLDLTDDSYPQLRKALREHSRKESDNARNFITENIEDAKEIVAAMDYAVYYSSDTSDTVYRADSQVFSFVDTNSVYFCGAHPGTYFDGITFDSTTGNEIELKDVVSDYDRLCEVTLEKLALCENAEGFYEDYETTVRDMFYGTGQYEEPVPEFYLTAEGINIIFNEYQIGPYATGCAFVNISYEECPDLFADKYVYNGEGRIQAGGEETPVYIDINGEQKEVKVTMDANNDEFTIKMKVSVGDKSSEFDFYGFTAHWSVLTDRNGNSFMYVETVVENDYVILEILKLDENGASFVKEISGLFSAQGYSTDPYNMMMCERMEALGSYTGYKLYHITESGIPETDDQEYSIRSGDTGYFSKLISTVDFIVYVNGEEVNAPAGTSFELMGTDNHSYVRAIMDDGRECEIRYVQEDYRKDINGIINEWDAFELLPYAG